MVFKKGQRAWNYKIPQTEDQKKRQSKTMKRLYASGEIINPNKGKNIDTSHLKPFQFKKGYVPWSKINKNKYSVKHDKQFQNGNIPWNYGLKLPKLKEEHRLKVIKTLRIDARVGMTNSEESKIKTSKTLKNKYSTGERVSATIGVPSWNSGLEGDEYLKHYKDGKHPNWQGGKSFEPYGPEFNKSLKNFIRKRDNQICMNCGVHREKLKEALTCHHINYDKNLNIQENLVSLCRNCHALTNFGRDEWTKTFQAKLSKLYGYSYDSKNNIVLKYNE